VQSHAFDRLDALSNTGQMILKCKHSVLLAMGGAGAGKNHEKQFRK